MADIQLDLNPTSPTFNDLLVVNGDLVLVTGTTEIIQNIIQVLRTYLGEWFLDLSVGIPYYQAILVKNPNRGNVDAILQAAIVNVPGVISLTTFKSQLNTTTRQLFVSFTAETTAGEVNYTGTV